mmetsp:Transcript_78588/g.141766  ORF Transcript_78588/g.141766 Transcript_78588/m.141766 type:complete len:93 (-) Transcript_78588:146-424(-)
MSHILSRLPLFWQELCVYCMSFGWIQRAHQGLNHLYHIASTVKMNADSFTSSPRTDVKPLQLDRKVCICSCSPSVQPLRSHRNKPRTGVEFA